MFPFNLINIFPKANKNPDPVFNTNYEPPSPGEIRQVVENLSRCPHCCFLIFDNYWSNEIDHLKSNVCPTCGHDTSLRGSLKG